MTISRRFAAFNDSIAIKANNVFSTMSFFWFCLGLALIPLAAPALMPFVQFASSAVLQLIALPLLAVGTVLAATKSDAASLEQHEKIVLIAAELQQTIDMITELHTDLHLRLDHHGVSPLHKTRGNVERSDFERALHLFGPSLAEATAYDLTAGKTVEPIATAKAKRHRPVKNP